MEIIDNKALLIRTKKGDEVVQTIPKSHILADHGEVKDVLVHWGLEEAQVLKNLRIKNVPSPITRDYKWGGLYAPFEHQKVTASFFTLHKRSFCFSEQGCVDADTEYLSPTWWKRIADYTSGEVAQYHPDTGEVDFVTPKEFVKLPCPTMVRVKTKYGVDQLLSPEHRVLLQSNASDKKCVMSAAEVLDAHQDWHEGRVRANPRKAGSQTIGFAHMAIPTVFRTQHGAGMPLTDAQLRVQVAAIADGHFGPETPSTRCVIRLKRPRKIERLRRLLEAAAIPYQERDQNTATAQGFVVFTFYAPTRDKEFGETYWNSSLQQRQIIADEVMHWDGCARGGGKRAQFITTSKASADFIQYVFVSQGVIARVSEDRRPKYKHGVCYTVTVRGATRVKHGALSISNRNANTVYLAPSTDGYKYCFMVPSTFLVLRRNGCVFATGNTGKTGAAIWAADYLMSLKFIRRVLVLCPLSIMQSAWQSDLFKLAMHRSVGVAYGTQKKRTEIIRGPYEFVIINYDGLGIVADEVAKAGFDLIIIDEANAYKNPSTKRWKILNKLLTPEKWLWMMTGTPAAQSPIDAYGLAKLVSPQRVPKYLGSFRDLVMQRVTTFKWAPRPNATKIVHSVLQPAIRFTKEQCLDLPPQLYVDRDAPLTQTQETYYKRIKKDMLAVAAGEVITATNAAALVSKLLQISAGAAYTDKGDVIEFDIASRFNVLREVIDETEHKVILFVNFRGVIQLLKDKLAGEGYSVDCIYGDVPAATRTAIFNRFQTTPDPKILIIQPQSAAHGVTLHAADTVVWWGPITSAETYLQGNARAHRAGQTKSVTVVHLSGSEAERKIYKLLRQNIDVHQRIVDLYEEIISDGLDSV